MGKLNSSTSMSYNSAGPKYCCSLSWFNLNEVRKGYCYKYSPWMRCWSIKDSLALISSVVSLTILLILLGGERLGNDRESGRGWAWTQFIISLSVPTNFLQVSLIICISIKKYWWSFWPVDKLLGLLMRASDNQLVLLRHQNPNE